MKQIVTRLASLSAAAGVLGCSVLGIRSGYEMPGYEVVDTLGSEVEVRRYGPRLAIETQVPAADLDEARDEAFRILFGYITGDNRAREEVAMTAPVETRSGSREVAMTAPVETRATDERLRMRFFAPSELTIETAPVPTDPRVRLVEAAGETLAVLRFSGLAGAESVEEHQRELRATVAESRWAVVGEPITLLYDPPFTLPFLRRNEVALPVRPAGDRPAAEGAIGPGGRSSGG